MDGLAAETWGGDLPITFDREFVFNEKGGDDCCGSSVLEFQFFFFSAL